MKKLGSILLATVMLFAVCTVSTFALGPYSTNDYERSPIDHTDGALKGEGTLTFYSATRSLALYLYCENVAFDYIYDIGLHAQCAVNYSDESQDFYTASHRDLIDIGDSDSVDRTVDLPADKTIISFDAEFHIGTTEALWEGYIYETFVAGINA